MERKHKIALTISGGFVLLVSGCNDAEGTVAPAPNSELEPTSGITETSTRVVEDFPTPTLSPTSIPTQVPPTPTEVPPTPTPEPTANPIETPIPMGLHTPEEGPVLWNGEEIPAHTRDGDFVEIDGELFIIGESGSNVERRVIGRLVEGHEDGSFWQYPPVIKESEDYSNVRFSGEFGGRSVDIKVGVLNSTWNIDVKEVSHQGEDRGTAILNELYWQIYKGEKFKNPDLESIVQSAMAQKQADGHQFQTNYPEVETYVMLMNEGEVGWPIINSKRFGADRDQDVELRLENLDIEFFSNSSNPSLVRDSANDDVHQIEIAGWILNFGAHPGDIHVDPETGSLFTNGLTLLAPLEGFSSGVIGSYGYGNAFTNAAQQVSLPNSGYTEVFADYRSGTPVNDVSNQAYLKSIFVPTRK